MGTLQVWVQEGVKIPAGYLCPTLELNRQLNRYTSRIHWGFEYIRKTAQSSLRSLERPKDLKDLKTLHLSGDRYIFFKRSGHL